MNNSNAIKAAADITNPAWWVSAGQPAVQKKQVTAQDIRNGTPLKSLFSKTKMQQTKNYVKSLHFEMPDILISPVKQ